MFQKYRTTFFYSILLLTINLYVFSTTSLHYDITQSPDFYVYIEYLYNFFGLTNTTSLDNGSIYFYFTSLLLTFYEGYYQGNNFLIILNNAVHSLNFLISLIGLIGYYFYFLKKGYKKENIFLALFLLSIFSPFLQMKMTMKPEILAFALIPYLLLNLEKYFKSNSFMNLFNSIILFSVLISLRVSIFTITSIFLLFYFFKDIKMISIKKLSIIVLLNIVIIIPLIFQDFQINGYTLFSNSEIRQEFASGDYDNRASLRTIININTVDLGLRPYLDNHADSFIGITLLDTFNDYFHLYWNRDKSLFNRNQLIKNIDLNNFYINKFFDNLEYYFGILFSIVFYSLLLKFYKQNRELKLLIAPFIGMAMLIINSLGIPYNNFNPIKGDTYKTFYYGFLLTLAFFQLILYLQEKTLLNKNIKKYFLIFIYVISTIIIFGFPKYYTQDMTEGMTNQYGSSPLCSINLKLDRNIKSVDCLQKDDNFCSWSSNYRKPEIDESGNKKYFKDDKFGLAILTKNQNVKFVYGFAECEDLKSDGYEFFISRERFKNLPITNLYFVLLILVNGIQSLSFFRFNKNS